MFPHEHGVQIDTTLPRSRLELFDGRGHDLHLHVPAVAHAAEQIVSSS